MSRAMASNESQFEDFDNRNIRILTRKRDLAIFKDEQIILWNRSDQAEKNLGNKTLGKLDYFKNIRGWRVYIYFNDNDFKNDVKSMLGIVPNPKKKR